MKFYLLLILSMTTILASHGCDEKAFSVGRNAENCQNYFMCMDQRRIDFWCPSGQIYDVDRRACRPGIATSCEFIKSDIPDDACQNDFFVIRPHPDSSQCHRFFVCMNYNMVPFECDPGFIFHIDTLACVPGDVSNCV